MTLIRHQLHQQPHMTISISAVYAT